MYDVIYVDRSGGETLLAGHVADRASAADIARRHASELHVGRMMLPGSVKQRGCVFVVPLRALANAA